MSNLKIITMRIIFYTSFQNLTHNLYLLGTFLFILLLASSCRSHLKDDGRICYTDFPKNVSLSSTPISINEDSVLLRYPFRLRVSKDNRYAVILDYSHDSCFYHLFTYPDFHFISSFGRKGQGAEETLSGDDVQWSDSLIWALDGKRCLWQIFRPADDHAELVQQIDLTSIPHPLYFVLANDSLAYIPDYYSGHSRLLRVNREGTVTDSLGNIPTREKNVLSATALAQAWCSFPAYNPRNGVLAMATQLGEVLEIYHPAESSQPIVVEGPNGEPHYQYADGNVIPDGIMGFNDVQVGDSCIYAIFQGRSFDDIGRMLSKGQNPEDGGRSIYVFSLTGKPLCRYELDCPICGFYVDEARQAIVAINVNDANRMIVTFDM